MGHRWMTWMLGVGLAAGCGADPAGPEPSGTCIAVVQAAGRVYVLDGSSTTDPAAVSTTVFAEVTRNIRCDDTPDGPGAGFEDVDRDGESNFLPAGTTLHPLQGVPTSERLAVRWGGEWRVVTTGGGS